MSHFQQKLETQHISAFDLITRLKELTGLVYLHDHNHPVIAFLPNRFLVGQSSDIQEFYHENFNHYSQEMNPTSILEFSTFDNNPVLRHHTNQGFQGGYIGFFSYDYSANLSVNIKSHPQPSFF